MRLLDGDQNNASLFLLKQFIFFFLLKKVIFLNFFITVASHSVSSLLETSDDSLGMHCPLGISFLSKSSFQTQFTDRVHQMAIWISELFYYYSESLILNYFVIIVITKFVIIVV